MPLQSSAALQDENVVKIIINSLRTGELNNENLELIDYNMELDGNAKLLKADTQEGRYLVSIPLLINLGYSGKTEVDFIQEDIDALNEADSSVNIDNVDTFISSEVLAACRLEVLLSESGSGYSVENQAIFDVELLEYLDTKMRTRSPEIHLDEDQYPTDLDMFKSNVKDLLANSASFHANVDVQWS